MDGPHGLGVTARDFGLKGPRGWAFRDVRVDAEPGSLLAVEGPSGSGRTCLLLALTGRMKPTQGVAVVGEFKLPRQMTALRRVSAVANVAGVTDLDPALTVGEHLEERALLQRRFDGPLRGLLRPRSERLAAARLRVDTALSAAGLDREALPKGFRTAVRDLERLEALRLSVALALIGRPGLLGVDDADMKLSAAEREEVWALLRSLTEAGTTVVAVCGEAPQDAVTVTTRAETARTERTDAGTASDETAHDERAAEDRRTGEARKPEDRRTEEDEETDDALAETGRS
ncbi:ATP-binding cassette domain-containing protein [Streptomyces sp. NBC_00289]|uniref:ATP-binding cassette domain-containing protein n=1 Tax=Streptomyces sp. NBC_00289 TaxID=2975703 RepID=UPI00324E4437